MFHETLPLTVYYILIYVVLRNDMPLKNTIGVSFIDYTIPLMGHSLQSEHTKGELPPVFIWATS